MQRRAQTGSRIPALFLAALGALAAPVRAGELLDRDVATAVDRGVAWLAANQAFANPSAAGDAAGLTMLALLRRTPEGLRIGHVSGRRLAPESVEAGYNRGADDRSRATIRVEPLAAAVVRPVHLRI
jgi:hypothetical protein